MTFPSFSISTTSSFFFCSPSHWSQRSQEGLDFCSCCHLWRPLCVWQTGQQAKPKKNLPFFSTFIPPSDWHFQNFCPLLFGLLVAHRTMTCSPCSLQAAQRAPWVVPGESLKHSVFSSFPPSFFSPLPPPPLSLSLPKTFLSTTHANEVGEKIHPVGRK